MSLKKSAEDRKVTKTMSFSLKAALRIEELSEKEGRGQGNIVEELINNYYDSKNDE
jgi:predicted DNA-binding protein